MIVDEDKISQILSDFVDWLKYNPNLGPFCLVIVFIFTTIVMFPATILAIGVGLAFKQAYKSTWYALI